MRAPTNEKRIRLRLEHLEDRTVPATVDFTNGTLTVLGTAGADNISINQANGLISVAGDPRTFNAADVKTVVVDAGDGDDTVTIAPSITAATWVYGGGGNDVITGGGGENHLYGGAGDNTVTGGAGANFIYGGPGNNTVSGHAGDQITSGSAYVTATPSDIAQQVLTLVNQQRAANGLAPLQMSGQLTAAAQMQSANMVGMVPAVGYDAAMSHLLLGAPQPTLGSRAQSVGYSYRYYGENIAYGYPTADSVMSAWMNSAGHRANILNPNYTQIGIAVAYTDTGMPYFTQEFGSPAPDNPSGPGPVTTPPVSVTPPPAPVTPPAPTPPVAVTPPAPTPPPPVAVVPPPPPPAPVTPPPDPPVPPAPTPPPVVVTAPAPTPPAPTPPTVVVTPPAPAPAPVTTAPAPVAPPVTVAAPTPRAATPPVSGLTSGGIGSTSLPNQLYAVGNGNGSVTVYNAGSGSVRFQLQPYANFHGEVRVATADITGDGVADIITAPGPGMGPLIDVFDGKTGRLVRSFLAFSPLWNGGAFVAAGDVNGDGRADIVVSADAGGGPAVRAFDGRSLAVFRSFYAYDTSFRGGVRVAVGDVNGDGKADIITAPGAGMSPQVKVFSGATGATLAAFNAYDPRWMGGVYVAAGDLNGDGKADIVVGPGAGGGAYVKVFGGANLSLLANFYADVSFTGGVSVAVRDVTGSGKPEIVTAQGRGGHAVRTFTPNGASVLSNFLAGSSTSGGVYVG